MTRRFITEAGVAPGMRVIEIGCGSGEVTEVLAALVGPTGFVAAIDKDIGALALARQRIAGLGISHVQFLAAGVDADLSPLDGLQRQSFDVLAGRRVLMYLRDPASVIRRFSEWLHSGGLVVFEESDSTMIPARLSPLPARDTVTGWLKRMLAAEGVDPSMGFHLPATLAAAGLEFERVRAEAVIQGQGTQYPLPELLKLLRQRMVAAGIATEDEVDSLMARLDTETLGPTSVYVSDISFCAWARKP
jgi:SAM-dependent methyltransferase